MHRWTQRDGTEWVCAAYDHGPLCRLCQRVDAALKACLANLDAGYFELTGTNPDGELRFRVTPLGAQTARDLLGLIPDGDADPRDN